MEVFKHLEDDSLLLIRWQLHCTDDSEFKPFVVNGGYYLRGLPGDVTLLEPLKGNKYVYVCTVPHNLGNYSKILNSVTGTLDLGI